MSRDAVKFGRMSKKQGEKVEDEVHYHRAQLDRPQQRQALQGPPMTETGLTTPSHLLSDPKQDRYLKRKYHYRFRNKGSSNLYYMTRSCIYDIGYSEDSSSRFVCLGVTLYNS
ncbi:hypothetical protein NPIL_359491 [Nephila pilipes]|uniref:Uncharacterized protein n=1 Tax=Nephila pilipes TaxID=299642 RepID=A0A8X6P334_NEPPI|nr:hypothetical protein NPIL_359491 [Nephila pilipes]